MLVSGILVRAALDAPMSTAAMLLGVVLIAVGVALAYRGTRDLGPSLSPMPRPTDSATLVERGVYSVIRHPIYAGLIVGAMGWSLITSSWLAFLLALVLAVVLDLKSRREEAWLRERFSDYDAYARRTRRFVPGLY